jgi:hypothetical protein
LVVVVLVLWREIQLLEIMVVIQYFLQQLLLVAVVELLHRVIRH